MANLATAPLRGLGHLAAGIRIDFCIKHQNIHIPARAQHVVETSETDVVGPSIAADEPNTLAHESIGSDEQRPCFGGIHRGKPLLQFCDALALRFDARLLGLVCFEQPFHKRIAELDA